LGVGGGGGGGRGGGGGGVGGGVSNRERKNNTGGRDIGRSKCVSKSVGGKHQTHKKPISRGVKAAKCTH